MPFPELAIDIFADGARLDQMLELARQPYIRGFTTNPTLMRKAGITDYAAFARSVLEAIPELPVSFEVFADDFAEMERQAHLLASWGKNVFVKIPITNTAGDSSAPLLRRLAQGGVQLNVTAITTLEQVAVTAEALRGGPPAIVSVFAGRIADTGLDPVPLMSAARALLAPFPQLRLLWASPRELLNLVQAAATGCHIITVTPELLAKLPWLGRDLARVSLDTVKMFHNDAALAAYELSPTGASVGAGGSR